MGRSQVAFNQRHGGRSGQKGGRGIGRGVSTSNHRPTQTLGDNLWRHNADSHISVEQQLEEKVLALESHGNYSNQMKEESSHEESFMEMSLDVQTLKECFDTLPLCDLLNLPPHLTEFIDTSRPSLKVQNEGEVSNPVTKDKDHILSLREEKEKRINLKNDDSKNEGPVKEVDEDDEDDDMESWLDSVIS
mmetsp:Transcript_28547/g.42190  ORF Transcript_28547/g.42190 Transcript_28547/m.42190 type:complete len:190 (+) Transcript_28547:131-700(+)|eukprot:CAMPEP_0194249372 /NCGR_PEP_ID=MMETSP0158-20130606/20335_1 /TAXON_ID=33649 /ORGANISM="Thalassionema nitzschioides, Strain L26-B" /LENGTH=189 /DNA_ID=CAMNT_0038985883 /DNA_START=60 /DNA_END=629 /DNA_ORIENTATION=+